MTQWIDTPDALAEALAQRPRRIGLDTEFIRERTYWPQLALVQLSVPGADDDAEPSIHLLDALARGMADAVAAVLRDPAIEIVMHSPSEDLVAFGHTCRALPSSLFDTQAAAALAGLGAGLGYQKLVQQLLDIELAKGETRSDWMRRPLSASQLDYAADDVRHLHRLHAALHARLAALGRLEWLREDSQRQLANAAGEGADRWPHLALRGAQFLDVDGQRRLLRLLRWRDVQARSSDRPRSWILDNELAVGIARANPGDRRALATLLDASPKSPRALRDALWHALNEALGDEADAPFARTDDRDKRQLRALQDAVAAVAREHELPDGVLASRRLLEALQDGGGWTGALAGWRRTLLEPRLAPLLQDRCDVQD